MNTTLTTSLAAAIEENFKLRGEITALKADNERCYAGNRELLRALAAIKALCVQERTR